MYVSIYIFIYIQMCINKYIYIYVYIYMYIYIYINVYMYIWFWFILVLLVSVASGYSSLVCLCGFGLIQWFLFSSFSLDVHVFVCVGLVQSSEKNSHSLRKQCVRQCVAVCCSSVLRCVAVCCGVLRWKLFSTVTGWMDIIRVLK